MLDLFSKNFRQPLLININIPSMLQSPYEAVFLLTEGFDWLTYLYIENIA